VCNEKRYTSAIRFIQPILHIAIRAVPQNSWVAICVCGRAQIFEQLLSIYPMLFAFLFGGVGMWKWRLWLRTGASKIGCREQMRAEGVRCIECRLEPGWCGQCWVVKRLRRWECWQGFTPRNVLPGEWWWLCKCVGRHLEQEHGKDRNLRNSAEKENLLERFKPSSSDLKLYLFFKPAELGQNLRTRADCRVREKRTDGRLT